MKLTRREWIAGATALTACSPVRKAAGDVLAAGQPAAILILALAPDRLLGWPRRPGAQARPLLPGADLPETGALASGGAPASLEAVAAMNPRLVLDYGDLDPRYRDIAARTERRLGVPYHAIDGSLRGIPQALTTTGALLDRADRGRALAVRAAEILDRWSRVRGSTASFYYARGADGLETGFAGSLATEVLEGAGWTNVATGGRAIGRVSREQVVDWDPEVLVTLDRGFAKAALADRAWMERRGGARRRLLLLPELPFGWVDRPPSINRLLGCAWLAGREQGDADARAVARLFWGERAGPDIASLRSRWLA